MPGKNETVTQVVGEREFVTTRILNAPRRLVFQAWTDPRHVAQWWGPNGFTSTIQTMDVRPGGEWNLIMHGPDGTDYKNKSVFVEVKDPERLVYDHQAPRFRSTVTFEDLDGRTRVTMTLAFETAAELKQVIKAFAADEGAKQTLGRMDEYTRRMFWIGKSGEDSELFISRVFDAPRALVYEAWSKPELFQRWFAPAGMTMPGFYMDFIKGGAISMTMALPDGTKFPGDGAYDDIVPLEKIAWTSHLRFQTPPMVVPTIVRFADVEGAAGKTQLTVHQWYIRTANPEGAEQGWSSTLENLAAMVARLKG